MGEIIAVINQKGGVGMTTTVMNMGAALARKGYKVLLIDMDPQCSLTYNAGGEYDHGKTIKEVIFREASAADCIQTLNGLDIIGGCSELSSMDAKITTVGKEFRFKEVIAVVQDQYDFIVVDTPPALSLITINVLTAASRVVVVANADVFSMQGIGQMFSTYEAVKNYCNQQLVIDGILLSRYANRLKFARQIREELAEMAAEIGTKVYESSIRDSIKVKEAVSKQVDIFTYAPNCNPAADYMSFVDEFLKIEKPVVEEEKKMETNNE